MDTKQSSQCPSCGKQLQEDFNICPYCGEALKTICVKCGKLLEEEYNNCPYCGAKVKGKSTRSNKKNSSIEYRKKIASILTILGAFILKIGRAIKHITLISIDYIKKLSQKALDWFRSINWGKSKTFIKTFGSKFMAFINAAIPWIKQLFKNIWGFLKKTFLRLLDSLSHILEKKFSPEIAKKVALGIIAAVFVLFLLLTTTIISGKSDSTNEGQETELSISNSSQPIVDPSTQKWLVMIYADADDEVLENDIYFDLNEAEAAGSSDRVQIVAQIDRFTGGYTGDGDWTGARRYYVTQDTDLDAIHSELAVDLGEVDMGSTDTLVDFATWAIQTYPADRYVLILSDHGSGWTGGWYDNDPHNPSGNFIALNQLDAALGEIIYKTEIGKFELIGLDACLMGMLEVYNSLEPHARYAVASEEVEPSMGWAYDYFLTRLTEHPEMGGAELSQAIVAGYIQQDLRIQDDTAYKELLAGYDLPENVDKELFSQKMAERVTLSAVDLTLLSEFNNKFNQLILTLKESDQGMVAEARSYSQAFLNIFDDGLPSPYIDLKSFLNIIAENNVDKNINAAISETESIFNKMIISEVHGSNLPGASGISIYFPVSQHYWEGGTLSHEWYPITTERFSNTSLWDDFLAYHYAGLDFGQGIPSIDTRAVAPGFSEITISLPVITPATISRDNPKINIQADISGDQIAYLYLISMFRYENRLLFYESDFILGDKSIDVNGVIYPYYERENGVKHVDLDYELYATAVSDGKTAAFAVLQPETYGTSPENTIYSVKGFYVDSQTGRKVSARMYFYNYGDNEMRNIVGYYGNQEQGLAPAEIIPEKGDQFHFLDTWWAIDENGNVTDELREGNILTFGDQPFKAGVATQFIYPGDYSIGIGAEDMDGNQTFSFSPIIVE